MTEKVYQLRTTEIRAALLKETMPRIVFQMMYFSWNATADIICKLTDFSRNVLYAFWKSYFIVLACVMVCKRSWKGTEMGKREYNERKAQDRRRNV